MKNLIALFVSLILAVSGYGQTRSVLVGTNGTVVAPTNFWSANASNATAGIGLGTAATNPASAFQPASTSLTNLAANNGANLTNISVAGVVGALATNGNGGGLTNLTAANITGTVGLASNVTGTIAISNGGTGATNSSNARVNLGATTIGNSLFTATNAAAARVAIGATTVGSSVVALENPNAVTFIRLNSDNTVSALSASAFRTALDLGTAATNPASAFQPSSSVLSNLASGNGVNLSNLNASNIVGLIPASNISTVNFSNLTGTLVVGSGGTGATNAAEARTNLGLALPALTNVSNSTFNTAIGLGKTNFVEFGTISVGTQNTNLSTNNSSAFGLQNFIDSGADESFAFGFGNTISNMPLGAGGSVVMGGRGNMTNQGAFLFNGVPQGGPIGNSRGNNTFAVNASNGIYLNGPTYLEGVSTVGGGLLGIGSGGLVSRVITNVSTGQVSFLVYDGNPDPSVAWTAFTPAQARTNLGLAWSALTNSNAGISLVSVNTNGEVVSPTNFWQVAPIVTRFVEFDPPTNATTNIVAARNLHIHSLAISRTGVTSTIALPTNNVFNGDIALVVHEGPTSSVTAVRQAGAATNLVTMNRLDEAVEFVYYNNVWQFNHNRSFIEPIYFSGTNASANAAASRTNLGLGANATVSFDVALVGSTNDSLELISDVTNSFVLNYRTNNAIATTLTFTPTQFIFDKPINFDNTTNAATTRTNLGLGATNNVEFNNITIADQTLTLSHGSEDDVFVRNESGNLELEAGSSIIAFSPVVASSTLTATSTVTAKTNLVVEGFVDFTTNHTNTTPATNNQINKFLEVRIGTNQFWLPLYK